MADELFTIDLPPLVQVAESLTKPSKRKPKRNAAGDPSQSSPMDRCQTPAYSIQPLLPYLTAQDIIWECAAGEGYLARWLRQTNVKRVIESDVLTGQNFFEWQPSGLWTKVITNPPYSIKYRWLARCYELGKPFALLVPVETLGAKTAQVLFRKHGVQVIFMDRRVNFLMPFARDWKNSAAQFPTCWVTWGFNLPSDMVFAELKTETAQMPLFEMDGAEVVQSGE